MIYTPWEVALESHLALDWPRSDPNPQTFLLSFDKVKVSGDLLHSAHDLDAHGVLSIWKGDKNTFFWAWRECSASVNLTDSTITYDGPSAQLESFLERVVLPTWLMLQPSPPLVLHASAVLSENGQAFGLMGPSGTGKSSTALALMDYGFQVITDDMLIVKNQKIMCAAPAVRLCGADPSTEDYPGSRKRRQRVDPPQGLGQSIVWVDLARGARSTQPVSGVDAFRRLAARRFDLSEWSPEQRAHQFEMLTETTRATLMIEFVFPTDPSGLPTHVPDLAKILNEMDL